MRDNDQNGLFYREMKFTRLNSDVLELMKDTRFDISTFPDTLFSMKFSKVLTSILHKSAHQLNQSDEF